MMNWGKLGRGGKGGKGGAAEATAAGLDAAWKETSLPKEGDMLKCKHFKVCPGCEFDRRFDETPIMVDSRSVLRGFCGRGGVRATGVSVECSLSCVLSAQRCVLRSAPPF